MSALFESSDPRALAAQRLLRARAGHAALRQLLPAAGLAAEATQAFEAFAVEIDQASEATMQAVWSDPSAYYLARVSMDLYRAVRSGASLPPLAAAFAAQHGDRAVAALEAALVAWALVALSVGVLDRRELTLPVPVEVRGPVGVLGSSLVITASGLASGVRAGQVVDVAGEPLRTEACPQVERADLRVRMQPYLFMVPGLVEGLPELGYQRAQQPLLAAVYARIHDVVPEVFARLASTSRVTILKPYHASDFVNQTHSHLPGGAMLSAVPEVNELADKLIHEWAHDHLFALEEDGPFLADPEQARDESIYSPWREDLRAVQGILHAIFVHLHVWPFWVAVRRGKPQGSVAALCADRLARYPLQMRLGLHLVREHGRLTERGAALMAWMEARTGEVVAEQRALGVTGEVAAHRVTVEGEVVADRDKRGHAMTVTEAIRDHAERCGGTAALTALMAVSG